MIALMQAVAVIASALTDPVKFTTNSAGTAKITYHQQTMPPRSAGEIVDIMPFCLIRPREYSMHPSRRAQIELQYCLYQPTRATALTDIASLMTMVEGLAVRGAPYAGWKLASVACTPGEKETGLQPHPEYYFSVLMDFIGPPIKRS
jgi:hypothetical protein